MLGDSDNNDKENENENELNKNIRTLKALELSLRILVIAEVVTIVGFVLYWVHHWGII